MVKTDMIVVSDGGSCGRVEGLIVMMVLMEEMLVAMVDGGMVAVMVRGRG